MIPDPKIRSTRWISTSVAPENVETDNKLCSADYQVNNAMNPVYFYEAITQIPANAVTIEVGRCFITFFVGSQATL